MSGGGWWWCLVQELFSSSSQVNNISVLICEKLSGNYIVGHIGEITFKLYLILGGQKLAATFQET